MNLRNLDLNLLVILDALLEEQNVSRAGQRIGLSQSATSAALARLREIFHDPLLVRVGRQLALTENAEKLIEPLRDALTRVEQTFMLQTGFDPSTDSRTFTISASDYAVLVLLEPFFKNMATDAPNITFHLLPRSRHAESMLQKDQVDIVIEPSELLMNSDYPSVELMADRWLCAIDENNPHVASAEVMTIAEFGSLPHVAYGIGPDRQFNLADQHLEKLGINRQIAVTVESFLLVPFLLQGTIMTSLVLERTIRRLSKAVRIRGVLPPVSLPQIHETMYWHSRHTGDPAHRWLRQRIQSGAAELNGAPYNSKS